ncbi:acylneuraminate cytidylyltransferase family protein [Alphaproteobacteria bacterium]|nr:acylneuraminate cytidylyltransferase family protein [Alphaproteobacteria bacterium]MDC0395329.1 acylneuraminate cytidylyltransferase family protein [Alphaproteobacteria bacterium]
MNLLAIIPARGGSKGVPRKNIRNFRGKPLISWTIKAAQESLLIKKVILSSDDSDIINTAKHFNCEVPFIRAIELAQDETSSYDVVMDAISRVPNFDWVILLQPTSPLRTATHIDEAIKLCLQEERMSCVSVTKVSQNPLWMFEMGTEKKLKPVISAAIPKRRQELPNFYRLNGAIYIANINWLKANGTFVNEQTVGYVMDAESSLDIDTEKDFNT